MRRIRQSRIDACPMRMAEGHSIGTLMEIITVRPTSRKIFSLILFAACAQTGMSCGPTLDEGSDARIRVTPPKQVTFSRVTPGDSRSLPFVVSSVGKDPLDVQRIEWAGSQAVRIVAENVEIPAKLEALTSIPLAVEYTPTLQNPAPNGKIRIYSNDASVPVYTLDVVAQQLAPQIHVTPSQEERLIIGQTDVGKKSTRNVVITNIGDLALNISDIQLNATSAFGFEIANGVTLPVAIAPNAANQLDVNVSFAPQSEGRAEGSLVILSNDPDNPRYVLPIIANSDTPCMRIEPKVLEFPDVSINSKQTRTVTLTSCSAVPLVISGVERSSQSDVFSYALSNGNTELREGDSAELEITFAPTAIGSASDIFTVMNNDPLQPNAKIEVMGTASKNRCPDASARARLSSSSEWAKMLDLSPLDTVIFDGSLSSDPEGTSLTYYWTVKSAPKDSTSRIVSNGPEASLFLDLAGNYEVCLNVKDADNTMSCSTDCIMISAVPRETIHVQLVWNTPGDDDQTDAEGADLDLHFMSLPDGTWGDTGTKELNNGTDVFFLNKEPVWPVQGQGNELPSLDIDDADGAGPENINLDHPTPCRWYAIGVHYYLDNAFGPSYATVRVYVDGKKRFERAHISLAQTGAFKHVAYLFWGGSGASAFAYDAAYSKDEDWIGKPAPVPQELIDEAMASFPECKK